MNFRRAFFFLVPSMVCANETPQGWLWYKEPAQAMIKSLNRAPADPQQKRTPKTFQERLNAQKQAFDESLAESMLQPTVSNVKRTQALQKKIIEQASQFQRAWTMVESVTHPFDESYNSPFSRELKAEQARQVLNSKLRKMAQEYGLFFIFSSRCLYCHKFARVVKNFAQTYGFEIQGISKDGQGIPGFEHPLPDNGIIQKINPEGIFPSLFLVHRQSHEIILLANSLLNDQQLLDHVSQIIRYLESYR